MSESVKGFCTKLLNNPPRIQVKWDKVTPLGFDGVEIVWWCIGDPVTYSARLLPGRGRYSHIPTKPGETYVVAARAHFSVTSAFPIHDGRFLTKWAYTVIEVPQEDKSQFIDLGEAHVIDTPKGPAILLADLANAFS